MKTSFTRAITPRSLERWKRPLGFGNRVEVQALQWSKYPLQVMGANRALLKIEHRILELQEYPYQYSAEFNRALSRSALKINAAFLLVAASSVAVSALHHQLAGLSVGLHDAPVLGLPLMLILVAGHYVKNSYLGAKRALHELAESKGALGHSRRRYIDLFQNAPVGFHNISPDGTIQDVNKRWLSTLGYSRAEVIGKKIFEFIVPEQRGHAKARFEARKAEATLPPLIQDRQYLRKDGSRVYAKTFDNDIRDESGDLVMTQTSFLDLTELRRLEGEISKGEVRQRDMAVAKLAMGGLIHALSQKFTGLMGFYNLLEMDPFDPKFKAGARQARKDIMKYFEDFSVISGGIVKIESIKVKEEAEAVLANVKMRFPGLSVREKIAVADDIGEIRTSETVFSVILGSILSNAFEAIEQKGEVSLTIEKIAQKDRETLTIRVKDSGRGMKPEVEEKMFLPFFSTDKFGMALQKGRSLALVYYTVDLLSGTLEVQTTPGKGTDFMVWIPIK